MHPDAENHDFALRRILAALDPFQDADLLPLEVTTQYVPPLHNED